MFYQTKKAKKAFYKLKKLFTSQLILAMFEPEKPITLETDALDGAIRVYLS